MVEAFLFWVSGVVTAVMVPSVYEWGVKVVAKARAIWAQYNS